MYALGLFCFSDFDFVVFEEVVQYGLGGRRVRDLFFVFFFSGKSSRVLFSVLFKVDYIDD